MVCSTECFMKYRYRENINDSECYYFKQMCEILEITQIILT